MKKVTKLLFVFAIASIIFINIASSAFNTSLYIDGSGILRAQAEVRIDGVENAGYYGEAIENFNPNYDVNKTNMSVNLPATDSRMEYTVTVKNYGNKVYIPEIELLSEVSNDVLITISDGTTTYNLPNDELNYYLDSEQEKDYTVTISNKPGKTNNNIVVSLQYTFVADEVTAPAIGISSNGNRIELVEAGSSPFGIANYEYYVSTSSTTPDDNVTVTGTTIGPVDINDINYEHFYIWYRSVSTKNTKSVWSNRVEVDSSSQIVFTNRQDGDVTVGDIVSINGEEFYVINPEDDSGNTVLLAKYNLLVGDVYNQVSGSWSKTKTLTSSDTGYGLQNENAKGYYGTSATDRTGVVAFSGKGYWDNANCVSDGSGSNTCPGTDGLKSEYANASNAEGKTGAYSSPYPYVYNSTMSSIAPEHGIYYSPWGYAQDNGYTIAYYVEEYVNTLKSLGAPNNITGRLLTYEEASSLSSTIRGTWSYWLGSTYNKINLMIVRSGSMDHNNFWTDYNYGARPVIVVSKRFIQHAEIEINVTFNADGGTVSPTSKTVTYGSAYGTLPTPEKEGFAFVNWKDSNNNIITSSSTVNIISNHTLTAVWLDNVAPALTLAKETYFENDLSTWTQSAPVSISSGVVTLGDSTNSGYITSPYIAINNTNWRVEFDLLTTVASTNYTTGGIFCNSEYYDSSYQSKVSSNGNSGNGWAPSATALNTWTTVSWDGWNARNFDYLKLGCGTSDPYSKPPVQMKNFKLYSDGLKNTFYIINYNASDNAGVSAVKYAKGNLAASYFETGGNVASGNKITVLENGTYTVCAMDAAGNTAVQTIQINNILEKYKVTLDHQSGSNATYNAYWYYYNTGSSGRYYYADENCTNPFVQDKIQSLPSKAGYTFGGYFTGTDGSGTQYVDANGYFINNVYQTATNRTLYAYWVPKPLYIYYHVNGGTVNSSTYSLKGNWISKDNGATYFYHTVNSGTQDDPYNYTSFGLTKSGYTATEWCNTSTGGTCFNQDTKYTYDQYKSVSQSEKTTYLEVDLYAKWVPKTIKITFNKNSGSGGTNEMWFKYGTNKFYSDSSCTTQITSITNPTRSGYTFKGYRGDGTSGGNNNENYVSYYNGSTFVQFASDLCTDIYKDATLYANWESNGPPSYTYTGTSQMVDQGSGNWYLILKSSGTLTFSSTQNVDFFAVGGGGGGGSSGKSSSTGSYNGAGGGGGGAIKYTTGGYSASGALTITIGAGGGGAETPPWDTAYDGKATSIKSGSTTLVSAGGGSGGGCARYDDSIGVGGSGGSTTGGTLSGTTVSGKTGGNGGSIDNYYGTQYRGNGGTDGTYAFGSNSYNGVRYGASGGGGAHSWSNGDTACQAAGGTTGGGMGATTRGSGISANGGSASDNTGAGGGGASGGWLADDFGVGGNGGSGVVIVRNHR